MLKSREGAKLRDAFNFKFWGWREVKKLLIGDEQISYNFEAK